MPNPFDAFDDEIGSVAAPRNPFDDFDWELAGPTMAPSPTRPGSGYVTPKSWDEEGNPSSTWAGVVGGAKGVLNAIPFVGSFVDSPVELADAPNAAGGFMTGAGNLASGLTRGLGEFASGGPAAPLTGGIGHALSIAERDRQRAAKEGRDVGVGESLKGVATHTNDWGVPDKLGEAAVVGLTGGLAKAVGVGAMANPTLRGIGGAIAGDVGLGVAGAIPTAINTSTGQETVGQLTGKIASEAVPAALLSGGISALGAAGARAKLRASVMPEEAPTSIHDSPTVKVPVLSESDIAPESPLYGRAEADMIVPPKPTSIDLSNVDPELASLPLAEVPVVAPKSPISSAEPSAPQPPSDPKYAGSINKAIFSPDKNIKDQVQSHYDANKAEIDTQRRAGMTMEQTTKASLQHAWTADELKRDFKPGAILNAEQATGLAGQARWLSRALADADPASPDFQATSKYFDATMNALQGVRAEQGRALNAAKISNLINDPTLPPQERARMALSTIFSKKVGRKASSAEDKVKGMFEGEVPADVLAEFHAIPKDDSVALNAFLAKQAKANAGSFWWLHPYLYANMLSSPITSTINTASNAANVLALQPLSLAMQGKSKGYLSGALQGMGDGMARVAFAMEHGYTKSGVESFEGAKGARLGGGLKNPLNFFPRVNLATDEMFKAIAHSAHLNAEAVQAAEKALGKGATRAEIRAKAEELKSGTDLILSADDYAKEATYQRDLGPIMSKVSGLINTPIPGTEIRPGKLVAPFVKTPANVIRQMVEFTPVGAVIRAGVKAAGGEAKSYGDIASKGLIGTALTMWAYDVAKDKISGAIPKDAKDRERFYADGRRPYSILVDIPGVGKTAVPFSAFGPAAGAFTAVAALRDAEKSQDKKLGAGKRAWADLAFQAGGNFVRNVGDQSFLTGINGAMSAITDPEKNWEKWAANTASQFIPMSGGLRWANSNLDPYVREADGVGERVIRDIPGASDVLNPRLNLMGQKIQRTPMLSEPPAQEPVYRELARLGLLPGEPSSVEVRGKAFKLSDDEKRTLLQSREQIPAMVRDVINSPDYITATDDEKLRVLKPRISKLLDRAQKPRLRGIRGRYSQGQGDSQRR